MPTVQVRNALCKKVSRERVGAELEGMFNGALASLPGLAGQLGLRPCQASTMPWLACLYDVFAGTLLSCSPVGHDILPGAPRHTVAMHTPDRTRREATGSA